MLKKISAFFIALTFSALTILSAGAKQYSNADFDEVGSYAYYHSNYDIWNDWYYYDDNEKLQNYYSSSYESYYKYASPSYFPMRSTVLNSDNSINFVNVPTAIKSFDDISGTLQTKEVDDDFAILIVGFYDTSSRYVVRFVKYYKSLCSATVSVNSSGQTVYKITRDSSKTPTSVFSGNSVFDQSLTCVSYDVTVDGNKETRYKISGITFPDSLSVGSTITCSSVVSVEVINDDILDDNGDVVVSDSNKVDVTYKYDYSSSEHVFKITSSKDVYVSIDCAENDSGYSNNFGQSYIERLKYGDSVKLSDFGSFFRYNESNNIPINYINKKYTFDQMQKLEEDTFKIDWWTYFFKNDSFSKENCSSSDLESYDDMVNGICDALSNSVSFHNFDFTNSSDNDYSSIQGVLEYIQRFYLYNHPSYETLFSKTFNSGYFSNSFYNRVQNFTSYISVPNESLSNYIMYRGYVTVKSNEPKEVRIRASSIEMTSKSDYYFIVCHQFNINYSKDTDLTSPVFNKYFNYKCTLAPIYNPPPYQDGINNDKTLVFTSDFDGTGNLTGGSVGNYDGENGFSELPSGSSVDVSPSEYVDIFKGSILSIKQFFLMVLNIFPESIQSILIALVSLFFSIVVLKAIIQLVSSLGSLFGGSS